MVLLSTLIFKADSFAGDTFMEEAELVQSLKENFGFPAFRGGQLEVIQQLVAGNPALAVFPTGSGKSLCYQLPALNFPGLTLVISPLIALMKDQVDFLCSKGIAAAKLDSTLAFDEYQQIWQRIENCELKMLFIAPERIANEKFFRRLSKVNLSMMVVDEAHCMSEWGHNFRPDYMKLKEFAAQLKIHRVLCLTATATPQVAVDICRSFGIADEAYVNTGFYRPNLEIRSTPCRREEKGELLLSRLSSRPTGAAVVYVTLQKEAEDVSAMLNKNGLNSLAYHAGMKSEQRSEIQETFMASKDAIVVATIAFGMGIDKANIRYVYHYNLPKSMENYSQEIGRAGRDGKPSICEIFSCDADRIVLENFTYGDTPTKEGIEALLRDLLIGENFDVSLYHLSIKHDIRPLVISTMLCYLELDEIIKSVGHFFNMVKFKPKMTSAQMLAKFDPDRQKFLKAVLGQVTKGRTLFTLKVLDTVEATGYERARITAAFNYLDDNEMIEMKVSEFLKNYRILKSELDFKLLAQSLFERFLNAEQRDIERIHKFTLFTRAGTCSVKSMLSYFGEERADCGHCDRCLGEYRELEAPLVRRQLNELEQQTLAEMHSIGHTALQTPRQLAKFLCGINSPAASRSRPSLSRHQNFGALGALPFAEILSSCEAL